ncbi:MAG: pilus assembly protein [Acidobacteria bacterium]|nr:MAG: pilus assembly protein [Acidobacteriota bacterium]
MRRLLRKRGEKGASLVEFAMVAPFLILLLFGIIEFAWVFATNLDVKHGAREGARITAVNTPDTGNVDLAAEICSRMDLVGSNTLTSITWASDTTPAVGEGVTVTVSTPLTTLTGIMDWAFGGVPTLDSTVEIRIEQPPDWSDGTQNCP